MTIKILFSL